MPSNTISNPFPARQIALALAALVAIGGGACTGQEEPAAPRRIIWIAIDSLAAKRLGFMGYVKPTSPWLDALAQKSVVFQRAFAPSNVTPRSVASSMTGRHYSHIQRNLYEHRLPADFTTLAEWFGALGFRTTNFNTNPMLRSGTGFEQGFDAYHDLLPAEKSKASLEELIATVRESYRPSGGREFVYIHTMDVHHPYTPPLVDLRLFAGDDYRGKAVVEGNLVGSDGKLIFSNLPFFQQSQQLEEADIDYLLSLHEGTIHYTDRLLPQLLDALHFDPAEDLLIVSADHGEQFFEHGYWLHGRSMLPEEIQVPLLVRWDGFPSRAVVTPVALVDWFPTFAELYSASAPDGLVGRSLLPALIGEALPERPVYSEAHVYDASGAAVVANGHLYWLCADNSKLTPWVDWPYAEFLCDLESDPHCEYDLHSTNPGESERLNDVLRELNPVWTSFSRDAIRPRQGRVQIPELAIQVWPGAAEMQQAAAPLSEREANRLRALGYLQ